MYWYTPQWSASLILLVLLSPHLMLLSAVLQVAQKTLSDLNGQRAWTEMHLQKSDRNRISNHLQMWL